MKTSLKCSSNRSYCTILRRWLPGICFQNGNWWHCGNCITQTAEVSVSLVRTAARPFQRVGYHSETRSAGPGSPRPSPVPAAVPGGPCWSTAMHGALGQEIAWEPHAFLSKQQELLSGSFSACGQFLGCQTAAFTGHQEHQFLSSQECFTWRMRSCPRPPSPEGSSALCLVSITAGHRVLPKTAAHRDGETPHRAKAGVSPVKGR